AVLACELGHGGGRRRVDLGRDEPSADDVASGRGRDGALRAREVLVGEDHELEEAPARGDPGDRVADPSAAYDENAHDASFAATRESRRPRPGAGRSPARKCLARASDPGPR